MSADSGQSSNHQSLGRPWSTSNPRKPAGVSLTSEHGAPVRFLAGWSGNSKSCCHCRCGITARGPRRLAVAHKAQATEIDRRQHAQLRKRIRPEIRNPAPLKVAADAGSTESVWRYIRVHEIWDNMGSSRNVPGKKGKERANTAYHIRPGQPRPEAPQGEGIPLFDYHVQGSEV